jgi:energy-coupling factor transport system permease protein
MGTTGILLWHIALIFIITRLFIAITPPLEQGVGIAYFFTPLLRIYPKVADFVLILTLTLRFVPLLMEEAQLLGKARVLKGAWPTSQFHKVIAVGRLIPPLLILSLRRADELAENLLARGYTSGTYQSVSFGEWTRSDQRGLYLLILWPGVLWGSVQIISSLA